MKLMNKPLFFVFFACGCYSVQAQTPTPTPSPTPPQYSVLDLGTLYGGYSGANAINNSAEVVGYTDSGTGDNRAFLYSGGSMVDIGTLQGNNTAAYGINGSGQVVGHSANSDNTADHAFLYSEGNMSDLGTLGGTSSSAYGINDSSQVVGISDTMGDAASHAFLYSGGTMTDLGTLPGGTQSFAYSINNSDDVVGWSNRSGGQSHAFLYSNGSMTDLGTLGGSASVAYAINDSGQIAGYAHISGDSALHAFLYSDGTMTDLGVLDESINYSYGHALNNSGQVVGYSSTSQGNHAFLYSGGTMYDLNDLCAGSGALLFDAAGINDLGQIAATGYPNPGGDAHAFLLRPITSAVTGETVSSDVSANSSYVTVPPVTNSSSPNNTTASLIAGSATGDTTVNITFTDDSLLNGFQAASDVVDVSGTGSDIIVLQVSYNEADAISKFGSEANARLSWLDPSDNQWKLAVAGNTGGTPQFIARAYDPATDFHLGYYGVDTVNNVVWAVINHNSVFTTGNPVPTVQVTVQTTPGSLAFAVDGTTYTSAQTFTWASGSSHTIATTSPQSGDTGVRYVWTRWSDNGAISHTVAPTTNKTYTATFRTQYYLTMTHGTGGTVSPASGWKNSGTVVSITATPTNNTQVSYRFDAWTGSGPGSYSGPNNPASITMNGPITENATFIQNPVQVTVQTNPAGLTFSVDGTTYTTAQTFSWDPGSSHTIATTSPQNGGTGVRYVWSNWSGGGAISHTVAPTTNKTYTATFRTQYYLTMTHGTGGTVSPASGWKVSGTTVSISATPASGYSFTSWSGSGTGSYSGTNNPASITMGGPITENGTFTHN
jgi:probable HAF family extracellular repeat protein